MKVRAIVGAEEVGRVSEAARRASLVAQGGLEGTVLLRDGAGQFAILQPALGGIHAERARCRLVPPGAVQGQGQEGVLDEVWEYSRAKAYQQSPQAARLSPAFDALCLQATGYHALKRRPQKKAELLRGWERSEVLLHPNAAEEGLRDLVKKKVSAGTDSERGRACRDPFASLKKTCLKLKVPFREYLRDRIFKRHPLPPLPDLIRAKAAASGA